MKKLKHTILVLCCLLVPATSIAQDKLAVASVPDIKPHRIDSLQLRHLMQSSSLDLELYPEWSNKYTHKTFELPQTLKIDLRKFCMPTDNTRVTSQFGPRWNRQHKGVDVKVYVGDTIRSAFEGKVRIVKYDANGYGNYIVIRHPNGLETIYGHLSKHLVKENQVVKCGEVIGLGGNTGRSTGSHLHFETRLCGYAINPELLFNFKYQDVTGDFYVFNRNTIQQNERTIASVYTVHKNDTIYSVARNKHITVEELCRLNGLDKRAKLTPGQILKLK